MIADKECMRFDCLPGGLWEGIIARLGPTDLSNLATVGNRELHQLASSDFIWSQVYQRDWGVDGEAHAAQAAASVLGSPPRPLSAAAGPSAALLEMAATDNEVAGGLSTPSGRPATWKLLYRAKKETEANWQAGQFSETRLQGHDDFIRCLELFQLPGARRRLVSASGSYAEKDCSIRVWELERGGEGRCVERLVGHEGPIWSMQSGGSRQGPGGDSIIASVGDDGTLRVWDLDTHRVGVSRRLGPERLMSLSWDVEGGRLAACNDEGSVAIWSLEQIQNVHQASEEGPATPGPEEQADGEFPSWQEVSLDCVECTPAIAMSPPRPAGPSSPTACMQLDGQLLITGEGCSGGRVLLWDVPRTELDGQAAPAPRVSATLGLHGRGVSCLAFQRASGALAVGSVQGGLRLWDVARCEASINLRGHKRDVLCMQLGAAVPGPLLLATGSADRTVRVWDARAAQCAHTLSLASMPYCLQLGGSGDSRLAVGCSDGSVHLWDLRAGSCSSGASSGAPLVLSGHADRVWALAMDESSLVSAGLDGDILVRSFLPSPQ